MTKPMNTWKERFLESFGHDHPWNGECASVNMGNDCDCRTKGMLMFIKAELQRQREEIAREIKIKLSMVLLGITGTLMSSGLSNESIKDCLSQIKTEFDDIIKKVGKHD